jgi:tyrosine-protein kinase Etk/Wzc
VQILDGAHLPDGPIPTNKLALFFGSILGGFILGALAVITRNLLHRKVSDPMMVEKKFGLTNLAIIPYSNKQQELYLAHNPKQHMVPLLAQADPRDLSIEALRSLRTSLQFALIDARNNVMTIIGVAPGIGKSFVSVNFAYLLADAGKKILLIDGDIRKGHLRDYFQVGKSKGLTEIICGTAKFEEVVIHGQHPKLDFLATGEYPPNPSELLMSQKFKEFIEDVSKHYDLVIIDTAPILAVTDAAIIAQHTGANFIVLASDMHDTAEIELALKRFAANKVHINGMIFNFSKPQKGLYRSGHAHKYGKYQYEYK